VLRAGKFQIPLGRFNEQFHPSFRWPQISRPLMFAEVLPVGLSDVGIQVRGARGRDTQLEYQAWLVNGFGEHEEAAEEPGEEEEGGKVAGLRGNLLDNNFDKTYGARIGINVTRGEFSTSFAVSGQTGKIDDAGTERLTLVDVDGSLSAGGATLHVEAVQSFLGQKKHRFDRFERGMYVQLAYTIGRWTPAIRWDYARQIEEEIPDPTMPEVTETEEVTLQQIAASIRYAIAKSWSVRLEGAVPFRPRGASDETTIAAMVAFVF
jgi:hypothetical protein